MFYYLIDLHFYFYSLIPTDYVFKHTSVSPNIQFNDKWHILNLLNLWPPIYYDNENNILTKPNN